MSRVTAAGISGLEALYSRLSAGYAAGLLPSAVNAVCIDHGTRKCGFACATLPLSPTHARPSAPTAIGVYRSPADATRSHIVHATRRVLRSHAAHVLVIGWPLEQDGRVGAQCAHVAAFQSDLNILGIPTLLWDERHSSAVARRSLRVTRRDGATVMPHERVARVDETAAVGILTSFLHAWLARLKLDAQR